MTIVNKIIKELIYGGHLLSMGATGVVLTIILLIDAQFNLTILLIPYLSTQIIYAYNHYKELDYDQDSNPERSAYLNKNVFPQIVLLIYIAILILVLVTTNIPTILFVLFIVVFGILYTDIFKARFGKSFVGSKNFYAALFWASQILVVPLFFELPINVFYIFIFCITFLTAFINSTFFDIKDVDSDRNRKIKTFPVVFGVKNTVSILIFLKILTVIPIFLGLYFGHLPASSIFFLMLIPYGIGYITSPIFVKDSYLVRGISYFVADGEYLLWPIMLVIISIFV